MEKGDSSDEDDEVIFNKEKILQRQQEEEKRLQRQKESSVTSAEPAIEMAAPKISIVKFKGLSGDNAEQFLRDFTS